MGLESGWNCHISLRSNVRSSRKVESVTDVDSTNQHQKGKSKAVKSSLERMALGASLPEELNRPAWYLDFPKWQDAKSSWGNGLAGSEKKSSKVSFDALLDVTN